MEQQTQQRFLVATLALSVLLVSAGTSMANLALPSISDEFSLSFSDVRWVVLSYLLAITFLSLIVGRLGDLKGQRNILLIGLAFFSASSVASAFALSFPVLVCGRVSQGIGAAALAVLPLAIAAQALPPQKMGRALGLLATMSAVGTTTGPLVGGLLIAGYGWRSVFLAMALLGSFNFLFAHRFIRPATHLNTFSQQSHFMASVKYFYIEPLLRVNLLSNLVITAVMASTLVIGPFFLTHALNLDPHQIGIVMSAGPLTSILSGTLAGYAVDRFGCRPVIGFGFLQSLVGTFGFIFLPMSFGAIGYALSAILLSFGYQLFLSANSKSFMKSTQPEHRATAAGALNLSRNLGLIAGTLLMGSLFDIFAKESGLPNTTEKMISNGFQITFSAAALFIAILLWIHFTQQKRRTYGKRFIN